jgi:Ca2+-binding RTX toxin-like protein
MSGDVGDDRLDGGAGADTIFGGDGNNIILGGDGEDLLYGGLQDDVLNGGAGNDFLAASAGNDRTIGGSGNDTFFASSGTDVLDTRQDDGSRDEFWYTNPVAHQDTILGFVSGEDVVRLYFPAAGVVIQGVAPVAGEGPAALFDTSTGHLSYDSDGAGGAAAFHIARLAGVTSLAAGDILFGS